MRPVEYQSSSGSPRSVAPEGEQAVQRTEFHVEDLRNRWVQENGVSIRGWAFTPVGEYLDASALARWVLRSCDHLELLGPEIQSLNGSFAIVAIRGPTLFAAVDRLRSIPLFFGRRKERFVLSDSADWVRDQTGRSQRSSVAEVEFAAVGYVTGSDTLYPGVNQLQAGQYLFNGGSSSPAPKFYFRHLHANFDLRSKKEKFQTLNGIGARMTDRLARSTRGTTLLVPLSGGYDSRYIACLLKRHADPSMKVRCYTYGRPDSPEVVRAKRVAHQLGFPIEFVDYTKEKWRDFFRSEEARRFFTIASNGASSPHIQDYIALTELRARGILDEKTTVVPGFCGDVLGGSFIPEPIVRGESEELLKEGLPKFLYERFFAPPVSAQFPEYRSEILERLERSLENEGWRAIQDEEGFASAVDEWVTRHRLARFIINAVRVYEYFGLDWRMPLWDNELMDFWYRVPAKMRIKNLLYNEYLFHDLFRPQKVAFRRPTDRFSSVILTAFCRQMPAFYNTVRRGVRTLKGKRSEVQSYNGFDALAELLKVSLAERGIVLNSPDINHYFARWFLLESEGKTTRA